MSFILLATAAAAIAASAGFFAARRAKRPEEAPPRLPKAMDPEDDALQGLPLALEDVVAVEVDDPDRGAGVGTKHTERWLAGAVGMFEGEAVIGAVFIAPEGAKEEAVVAFASPRRDIGWISRVEVEIGQEPPSAIELGGVVMQRKRRLFVRLERLGKGAPDIGPSGLFAEYAAGGGAIGIVLRGEKGTFAWSGRRFDAGQYDRMGSAKQSEPPR